MTFQKTAAKETRVVQETDISTWGVPDFFLEIDFSHE